MTYDVFIEAGLDDDENEPNENTIDGDHDDTFDDIKAWQCSHYAPI